MIERKQNLRIADNPSPKAILSLMPLAKLIKASIGLSKKVGIKSDLLHTSYNQVESIIKQSSILTLPDRFNDAFAKDGWVSTSSMSTTMMETALDYHNAEDFLSAEKEILNWFDEDTINFFVINRVSQFNKAHGRWDQLKEALKLTVEERYMSAVPLILIACDGFASDILGKSPFEKNADLTVFDSIAGHPTSLPSLIKQITRGVRRSSDETLTLPMRHGIIHGRSLGYANREVCMKSWLLMISLVDWAKDKTSEGERIKQQHEDDNYSITDFLDGIRENNRQKEVINTFKKSEYTGPFNTQLDKESPSFAFFDFFEGWKTKNFGKMAKRTINTNQHSIKYLAGIMRQNAGLIELASFKIKSVKHLTVARSEAIVYMSGVFHDRRVEREVTVIAFKNTTRGNIAIPPKKGQWYIQQGCIWDLIHEHTNQIN